MAVELQQEEITETEVTCDWCMEKGQESNMVEREVFDTPWDNSPNVMTVHEDECYVQMTRGGYTDFWYKYCEGCGRHVCYRNPSNGYRGQFKLVDGYTEICVACYQEELLQHGQPIEDFEGGSIGGGDFFNYSELEAAGFAEVDEIFVRGTSGAEKVNEKCSKLIAEGNLVIVNFERLSIGGGEGTVSIWAK